MYNYYITIILFSLTEQMGEHAASSHTSVSILGIEGSTCAMDTLSQCASISKGTVNILNPLEMVRQIRLISQNPIIATEVELTFLAHPAVIPDRNSESKRISLLKEQVGNATRECDISFTFTVDASKLKNVKSIPFQVCSMQNVCYQNASNKVHVGLIPDCLKKDEVFRI